jgi:hypothetical protein
MHHAALFFGMQTVVSSSTKYIVKSSTVSLPPLKSANVLGQLHERIRYLPTAYGLDSLMSISRVPVFAFMIFAAMGSAEVTAVIECSRLLRRTNANDRIVVEADLKIAFSRHRQ